MYDLIIRGGTAIDGSGQPGYQGTWDLDERNRSRVHAHSHFRRSAGFPLEIPELLILAAGLPPIRLLSISGLKVLEVCYSAKVRGTKA